MVARCGMYVYVCTRYAGAVRVCSLPLFSSILFRHSTAAGWESGARPPCTLMQAWWALLHNSQRCNLCQGTAARWRRWELGSVEATSLSRAVCLPTTSPPVLFYNPPTFSPSSAPHLGVGPSFATLYRFRVCPPSLMFLSDSCTHQSIHPSLHPSGGRLFRDAGGQEDVLVIDLLSLKDGLLLPRSLSAILCGPFGSPDVLKLGGMGALLP